MSKELKSTRLQMVIEPSLIIKIDEYRRSRKNIPSRSEAIRFILSDWLQAKDWAESKGDYVDDE